MLENIKHTDIFMTEENIKNFKIVMLFFLILYISQVSLEKQNQQMCVSLTIYHLPVIYWETYFKELTHAIVETDWRLREVLQSESV